MPFQNSQGLFPQDNSEICHLESPAIVSGPVQSSNTPPPHHPTTPPLIVSQTGKHSFWGRETILKLQFAEHSYLLYSCEQPCAMTVCFLSLFLLQFCNLSLLLLPLAPSIIPSHPRVCLSALKSHHQHYLQE